MHICVLPYLPQIVLIIMKCYIHHMKDKELIEFYNQVTVKIRSEQNYIMLHNLVMQQKH